MRKGISRREFLAAGAALAVSPAIPRWPRGEEGFSFAYFSDTHVRLNGNLDENVAMLREMAELPLEFAINGGDVTEYGWTGEYDNYRKVLETLPVRTYHVAGNHDVRWSPLGPKAYKEGTNDPLYQSFDHQGVHFVLLDSTVPLSHWGHYESEMLRWLEADLKKVGRETPVFICTHHWVGRDTAMIDNEAQLLKIIEPYNIKLLLTGHGHNDLLWTINGIPATMNKGLYQGSWQRVVVDRVKGEVRLARRAGVLDQKRPLRRIHAGPLGADKDKRPVWALPAALGAGVEIKPAGIEWTEARWDDMKFVPAESVIATQQLLEGTHRLVVRKDAQTYFDLGETVVSRENGKLRRAWSRKLSGGVMSHLVLHQDKLLVSCMDGALYALSADGGRELWRRQTEGYCHSTPSICGPALVVGSADGKVYAFNPEDGEPLWSKSTDGPVYGTAGYSADHGVVCIGSGDGFIYGFDARTGAERWKYEIPRSNTSFVQSQAVCDGKRFYLGAWDKKIYALDASSGKLAWSGDCVGERSWAYSPAIGFPVYTRGRVVIPANGNNLICWNTDTQSIEWNTSASGDKFGYSSPLVHENRVYVGCLGDLGEGRCVDIETGAVLWTCQTGSVIYDAGPAITTQRPSGKKYVLFGSVSGLITACDAANGEIYAQYKLPTGHLLSTPVGGDSCFYVGSYSDEVARFDI